MEWNGVEWSGVEWSGMGWSRMEWAGVGWRWARTYSDVSLKGAARVMGASPRSAS